MQSERRNPAATAGARVSEETVALPAITLRFMEEMGSSDLLYTPAQALIPGADSYMNWPYALTLGFRLLRLDVHVPKNADRPVPVIVYISGGAFMLVGKNQMPWRELLDDGFAVVSIEYRLSGEATFPAQVHDVKAAIRWVRAHAGRFGFDPDRIVGWGSSAGAYLMAMTGVTNGLADFEGAVGDHLDRSSRLDAVIACCPATDFATLAEDTNHLGGSIETLGTANSSEARLLGFVPSQDPERTAKATPATYVAADTVPFLLAHGDADTRVGLKQSRRLYDALVAAGADAELHILPGAGHGGPAFDTQAIGPVRTFLHRVAGGRSAGVS